MVSTTVSAERKAILSTLRAFCDAEIRPYALQWDEKQEFPREVVRKLGELGFLGVLTNSHPGLGLAKALTTISWLIACGAVVFLWQRPSSAFFRRATAPGRPV